MCDVFNYQPTPNLVQIPYNFKNQFLYSQMIMQNGTQFFVAPMQFPHTYRQSTTKRQVTLFHVKKIFQYLGHPPAVMVEI